MIMRSKKGIAPLIIIGVFLLSLLAIYILLFLPIPSFTKVRMMINYFLVGILFILIQALFIYLYIHLGKLALKGINFLKVKIFEWNTKINKFIYSH